MLNKIFENIENKIPMALIRFGDGEKNIINNIPCQRAGFSYDPGSLRDRIFQDELLDALYYNGGKNYFVGINNKKLETEVNGTVISPMVFVNENYLTFLEKLKGVSKDIPIILVINLLSRFSKMPFNFNEIFLLTDNAWHSGKYLHENMLKYLNIQKETNLVLVAGGAFSCTLIHKIWQNNQEHILLDIGSTLDPWLFGKHTRQYHKRLDKC